MTDPIIFISRNRVKEGLFDDFRKHYQNSVPLTEADKPGTFAQLAYVNEDAAEVTIVRIFPNAEALDLQLQGADERSKITYQIYRTHQYRNLWHAFQLCIGYDEESRWFRNSCEHPSAIYRRFHS